MKQTLLIFNLLLIILFFTHPSYSQEYKIIGSDICSDGSHSANISLSDSDPGKLYALYRDGELLEVRSVNTGKTPNLLAFGNYSDFGKYTVVEFNTQAGTDFKDPGNGRKIPGGISIYRQPEVYISKKIEVRSGTPVNFQPKGSMQGSIFRWTARLEKGKAEGYNKSGEGIINDKIELQGNEPACIIYAITPYGPDELGGCKGNTRELIVWINP
jgi:hypothetical protein